MPKYLKLKKLEREINDTEVMMLQQSFKMLVWDTFASHKSEATRKVLRELKLEPAFVPGGCTKFVQVFNVCKSRCHRGGT